MEVSDDESEKELFDTRTPYDNVEVNIMPDKQQVEVDFQENQDHHSKSQKIDFDHPVVPFKEKSKTSTKPKDKKSKVCFCAG